MGVGHGTTSVDRGSENVFSMAGYNSVALARLQSAPEARLQFLVGAPVSDGRVTKKTNLL